MTRPFHPYPRTLLPDMCATAAGRSRPPKSTDRRISRSFAFAPWSRSVTKATWLQAAFHGCQQGGLLCLSHRHGHRCLRVDLSGLVFWWRSSRASRDLIGAWPWSRRSRVRPHGQRAAGHPIPVDAATATTMAHPAPPRVTIGAGTHLDVHAAHAGDQLGRRLATVSIPTTPAGYQGLLAWARGLGEVEAFGIEGTGSYGAALARFLRAHRQVVLEGNRPDRQARRRRGKSDPLDAEAAARAVQAGEATALPKAGTGQVEMIRSLRVARASAMKARTQAINAIKALLVTAPDDLRQQLRDLPVSQLVRTAARLRPGAITTPTAAAKLALRALAERHQALSAEIKDLDTELDRLTAKTAARLVALFGV